MVHKTEKGTYHRIEKLTKDMPGFLSSGKGMPLFLISEYSGINKDQRIPDRSKTAHRKPPVGCFLILSCMACCILWILSPLSVTLFANIFFFSFSVGCLHFADGFLCYEKAFKID